MQEPLWAVDIVKGSKVRNWPIDVHGVRTKLTPRSEQEPVWVRAAEEDTFVASDVCEVAE